MTSFDVNDNLKVVHKANDVDDTPGVVLPERCGYCCTLRTRYWLPVPHGHVLQGSHSDTSQFTLACSARLRAGSRIKCRRGGAETSLPAAAAFAVAAAAAAATTVVVGVRTEAAGHESARGASSLGPCGAIAPV